MALPLALFYTFYAPPFQVADEHAHLARAEHLLRGNLRAINRGPSSGGLADTGATAAAALFGSEQPSRAVALRAWQIKWSGVLEYRAFSNTVRYPPLLYLPQMAGVALGRLLDLPVLAALYMARLANALCMIALSALAIRLAPRGKALLMFVLLMPMTCQEFSSSAQDAGLIAGGVMLAALGLRRQPWSRAACVGLALLLAAMTMARPPLALLIGLLLVPGFAPALTWRRRAAMSLAVLGATLGWFAIMQQVTGSVTQDVDTLAQARVVLHDPLRFLRLALACLADRGLMLGAVGALGWLNVLLAGPAYKMARLGFCLVCLATSLEASRLRLGTQVIIFLSGLGSMLLMALATYLTWNPVGHDSIFGMQGRYLLPLLPLLALGIPHLSLPQPLATRLRHASLAMAAVCGLATVGFGVKAMVTAYRFSDAFPFL